MKKVFICSPLRGDIQGNIEKARGYCREAIDAGHLPIAPHVYFTQFLDDLKPDERTLGLELGRKLLKICDEVWVYGKPSEGMKAEIYLAHEIGIPVATAGGAARYTEEPDRLGRVTIHVPSFEAMAICNQHLNRPSESVELDGELIVAVAELLKEQPGANVDIGPTMTIGDDGRLREART